MRERDREREKWNAVWRRASFDAMALPLIDDVGLVECKSALAPSAFLLFLFFLFSVQGLARAE